MSSIGNTLAAACSWPVADAAVVVVAAEVGAGAAAVAVAVAAAAEVAPAALVAAEVAAAAGSAAAATVVGGTVVGGTVGGTGMAGLAADPGERAACAKSHKKRRRDGRQIVSGPSARRHVCQQRKSGDARAH
jgi:hypothetical protein